MRGIVLVFAFWLSVCGQLLLVGKSQAGDTITDEALTKALASYNHHNYPEAYGLFADSAGKHPGDGTAWLYAAHCLYRMGNISSAGKLYSYVQIKFPKSQNASFATEMLKRLEKLVSVSPPAPTGDAYINDSKADSVRESANSGPSDCSDLIEVVRPLYGHPCVSEATTAAVRRVVKALSPNVIKILRKNGAKVFLTPTLIDKEPSLKNREGRGYDGYTYKSCPGMFWNNRIYLCERTLDENDDSVKEPILLSLIIGTFYHECGHALDEYLDDLSGSEEFKHAYLLDCGKIDADTKAELSYFLQKSDAGQEECCGELIGILLGKTDKKADRMREAFPLTLYFLRGRVCPK